MRSFRGYILMLGVLYFFVDIFWFFFGLVVVLLFFKFLGIGGLMLSWGEEILLYWIKIIWIFWFIVVWID